MAAWNVLVGGLSVVWMILFVFLGCSANDNNIIMNPGVGYVIINIRYIFCKLKTNIRSLTLFYFFSNDSPLQCSASCSCDYVPYSPVCSADGITTYISACHAGCHDQIRLNDEKVLEQIYTHLFSSK